MLFCSMSPSKYFVLLALAIHIVTTVSARKINIKINLGGNAVDNFSGEEEFLQLGEEVVTNRYHGDIKGSGDDLKVFKTQRFAREEDLVIHVPVPDGIYAVTLMFAETWSGAFEVGKRVFDVYLGSKPRGIVKVAEQFDPFKSGGPAGPVRRKYSGIATYDGLTVALRPIKQNAQIAGIAISGFSYSEPLLDQLPTVPGDLSPLEDFSVLNSVGPRPADPSILYDPGLNPKFKGHKGVAEGGPSINISPHQTQGHASGPSGSPSSSTYNSFVQKSPLIPNSQTGYGQNSLPGPPASQFGTSPGAPPRISVRVGTNHHAEVGNAASSQIFTDGKHEPAPRLIVRLRTAPADVENPSSSKVPSDGKHKASPSHHRYGRHISSIPVESNERSPLTESGSAHSNTPHLSQFVSPSSDHPSSNHIPGSMQQGSAVPKYSDYSASMQEVDINGKQAFNDGQIAEHVVPMDGRTSGESVQQKLGTENPNVYQRTQDRGVSLRVLSQVQEGSITSSSPLSPQTHGNPESAYPDMISQTSSARKSMADAMKPAAYESASLAYPQKPFSETSGIQEPTGQGLQSQIEGRSLAIPSSGFHSPHGQQQFHAQIANMEQRNAMVPPEHIDVSGSQANAMGRTGAGDAKDFDSVSGGNGHNSQEGSSYQGILNSGQSFRGSRMGQPLNSVASGPGQSRSGETPPSIVRPLIGIDGGRVDHLASFPPKMGVQRQNALSNALSGLIDKVNAGSTEPTWQRVRAFLGTGEVGHSTPAARPIESPGREDYQAVSSRSMRSMSAGPPVENEGASHLRGKDFRTEPIISLNMPASSAGVHNGNGKLDSLCIDNSTHCSCGMVEQGEDSPEECLFVVDENVNPMVCITRPCSGKLVCACAPGASSLCQRSVVNSILVRASTTTPEGIQDPSVAACKRETLENGIMVLSPVM